MRNLGFIGYSIRCRFRHNHAFWLLNLGARMLTNEIVERRSKPRITSHIPATVRGRTPFGKSFEIETVLDNLSTGGLHVRLEQCIDVAASVSAFIRFAGTEIEAGGMVNRVEPQPDGSFGLAVTFESYRVFGLQYRY